MVASSLTEKIEIDVPIKATPQQFYDVLLNKMHHLSNICPHIVKSIEVQECDIGTEGCILSWNYTFGGKTRVSKQRMEEIDKENMKITYKVLEGFLLEDYKSFKFIAQVIPKSEGNMVRWIIEYEKLDINFPNPYSSFNLSVELLKCIDTHLCT